MDETPQPLPGNDAKQGQNMGVARKVLVVGLVLVIIAFIVAFQLA